ncbi:MAG: hypothetical protein WA159_18975 [Variovorax sp.]
MTAVSDVATVQAQCAPSEFDEAFFSLVDRVGLARKQGDPYRLQEVHRALQEEVRLASVHDATDLDRPRRRDPF